jgi:hypothetical protein
MICGDRKGIPTRWDIRTTGEQLSSYQPVVLVTNSEFPYSNQFVGSPNLGPTDVGFGEQSIVDTVKQFGLSTLLAVDISGKTRDRQLRKKPCWSNEQLRR